MPSRDVTRGFMVGSAAFRRALVAPASARCLDRARLEHNAIRDLGYASCFRPTARPQGKQQLKKKKKHFAFPSTFLSSELSLF